MERTHGARLYGINKKDHRVLIHKVKQLKTLSGHLTTEWKPFLLLALLHKTGLTGPMKECGQQLALQPGYSRITRHLKIIKARVPARLNWHLWEWGQASFILNTPLMNFNPQPSWRTTGLDLYSRSPSACLFYWMSESKASLIWHQNIWRAERFLGAQNIMGFIRNPCHQQSALWVYIGISLQLESFQY